LHCSTAATVAPVLQPQLAKHVAVQMQPVVFMWFHRTYPSWTIWNERQHTRSS